MSEGCQLKFNKKLYTLKAIKSAINAYQDFAEFSLKQKGNYFQLEMKNISPEVESRIKDEFANYVLSLMKL